MLTLKYTYLMDIQKSYLHTLTEILNIADLLRSTQQLLHLKDILFVIVLQLILCVFGFQNSKSVKFAIEYSVNINSGGQVDANNWYTLMSLADIGSGITYDQLLGYHLRSPLGGTIGDDRKAILSMNSARTSIIVYPSITQSSVTCTFVCLLKS